MTDFIILAVIIGLVVISIGYYKKNKKEGKSSCGCSCGCSCDNCKIEGCSSIKLK